MIWTRELLEQLKKAIAGKKTTALITFEGQQILVSYAQYLVEYIEPQLAPAPKVAKVTLAEIVRNYEEALDET